jgi:hypothetical protein
MQWLQLALHAGKADNALPEIATTASLGAALMLRNTCRAIFAMLPFARYIAAAVSGCAEDAGREFGAECIGCGGIPGGGACVRAGIRGGGRGDGGGPGPRAGRPVRPVSDQVVGAQAGCRGCVHSAARGSDHHGQAGRWAQSAPARSHG